VSFKAVHASRGKRLRAEPVAALYEQNRVVHVGVFPELEDELVSFDQKAVRPASPDRADALVWALSELMLVRRREPRMRDMSSSGEPEARPLRSSWLARARPEHPLVLASSARTSSLGLMQTSSLRWHDTTS
jgi:hypothetical protein